MVLVAGQFGANHSDYIVNQYSINSTFSGSAIFLQTGNKDTLVANVLNLFEFTGFIGSPQPGGNLLINATGVQPSTQNYNLIASEVIIVSRPVEMPEVPADPCGTGSSLELRSSNGVLPAYGDILPFSAFPNQQVQAGASVFSEALEISLANNTIKKISCEKA